jgi:hypothetical protein
MIAVTFWEAFLITYIIATYTAGMYEAIFHLKICDECKGRSAARFGAFTCVMLSPILFGAIIATVLAGIIGIGNGAKFPSFSGSEKCRNRSGGKE